MSETNVLTKPRAKKKQTVVPDYLVYEVVRGKPIYYKGYKEVLNGTKTLEEVMADSKLQAGLKARLTMMVGSPMLEKGYEIATGELGFNLSKDEKRAGDISIFKAEDWSWDEHYSDLPPEIVIEIDIKAQTENFDEMGYVLEKIEDYHRFGIKKVIWIFTKNRKIMVATQQPPWLTYGWDADLEVVEGVRLNLNQIIGVKEASGSQ